jgi:hypothetical protein
VSAREGHGCRVDCGADPTEQPGIVYCLPCFFIVQQSRPTRAGITRIQFEDDDCDGGYAEEEEV